MAVCVSSSIKVVALIYPDFSTVVVSLDLRLADDIFPELQHEDIRNMQPRLPLCGISTSTHSRFSIASDNTVRGISGSEVGDEASKAAVTFSISARWTLFNFFLPFLEAFLAAVKHAMHSE